LGIDIPIPLSNEVFNNLFYLAVWLSLIGVPLTAYIGSARSILVGVVMLSMLSRCLLVT